MSKKLFKSALCFVITLVMCAGISLSVFAADGTFEGTDDFTDLSKIFEKSPTVELQDLSGNNGDNKIYFYDDYTAVAQEYFSFSEGKEVWITYKIANGSKMDMVVYAADANKAEAYQILASSDNQNWTKVNPVITEDSQPEKWLRFYYTIDEFPAGTNYVKIVWTNKAVNYSPQIGKVIVSKKEVAAENATTEDSKEEAIADTTGSDNANTNPKTADAGTLSYIIFTAVSGAGIFIAKGKMK